MQSCEAIRADKDRHASPVLLFASSEATNYKKKKKAATLRNQKHRGLLDEVASGEPRSLRDVYYCHTMDSKKFIYAENLYITNKTENVKDQVDVYFCKQPG